MGSNGEFPEGVRVLVVDHDSTSNLEKLLKKFKYQAWACNSARAAMDMLGEKNEKYNFEIVISDVNMKDMDGFKFLQHVAHKLDVPVIMMSADGKTGEVVRGIDSGACAYLPKPIESSDAQLIWQHVYRKRIARGPTPMSEIVLTAGKNKRELVEHDSSNAIKKPRLIWTPELHQRFENAVDQIRMNGDKLGPKRIQELMGDTSLTREQIASHLQKYRSKIERETPAASDTNNYPSSPPMMMMDGLKIHQDIAIEAQIQPPRGFYAFPPSFVQPHIIQQPLNILQVIPALDTNSYPQQPSSPPMMIDAPIINQDIAIEAQIQPPNPNHAFHQSFVQPHMIQQALNQNM